MASQISVPRAPTSSAPILHVTLSPTSRRVSDVIIPSQSYFVGCGQILFADGPFLFASLAGPLVPAATCHLQLSTSTCPKPSFEARRANALLVKECRVHRSVHEENHRHHVPMQPRHQVQLWMMREHERKPPISSSLALESEADSELLVQVASKLARVGCECVTKTPTPRL